MSDMNDNQFGLLLGSIQTLQNQVSSMDAKLDAVNVETARQGVKISQLEQATATQKTFISTILATAIAGALASWAAPTLIEKTSESIVPKDVYSTLVSDRKITRKK